MPGAAADDPRIDDAGECIWRGRERLALTPKAFAVLRRLRQEPQQLVSKRELLETVWADTFVSDGVLNNAIGQLRQALGDDPKQPRFIETVHKRGFRWIGPTAPAAAAAALPREDAGTFVGRADTLADLERAYARAADGQREMILVTGEPGIGKTRLIDELVRRLVADRRDPAPLIAQGQCVEQFGAIESYRPILDALATLLRGAGADTRALFVRHAPTWLKQVSELLTTAEREQLAQSAPAAIAERLPRELEGVIVAASLERPLVLVVEDLHWSDHPTVGLVWALAAGQGPSRLLIVVTYRAVDAIVAQNPIIRLRHELTAKRRCREIALAGLDANAVGVLLDHTFVGHRFPPVLAAQLQEQTAGNPLFLANAMADFTDRGWVSERDGVWEWNGDLDAAVAAVPESTRQLIAFRIEQLPAAAVALLEAASVVGVTFATQTVAAAAERTAVEVEEECERLTRGALFLHDGVDVEWPDRSRGRRHGFRHALYRQVLLGRITPTRRQLLHGRIAARLEGGYADDLREVAAELALHHEHAGNLVRAAECLEIAAKHANARSANQLAEALLARAVSLLEQAPPGAAPPEDFFRITIAHALAAGGLHGHAPEEARRAFAAARALGQSLARSEEYILSLGSLGLVHSMHGELQAAHAVGTQMLALAGDDGPPSSGAYGHASAGGALVSIGDITASVRHMRRAADLADVVRSSGATPIEDATLVALGSLYGLALVFAGSTEAGVERVYAALTLARAKENVWLVLFGLSTATSLAMVLRDLRQADALTTELLAHCEANALPVWREMALVMRRCVEVHLRRDPALIDGLRLSLDEFLAVGLLQGCRLASFAADACLAVGRIDDAARAVDQGFAARGEEHLFDVELLRLRAAVVHARAGTAGPAARQGEQAEELLVRAVELAQAQGNLWFGLRAGVDLCRLWNGNGQREQARHRLGAALAAVSADGAPDVRAAQELLAAIERSG